MEISVKGLAGLLAETMQAPRSAARRLLGLSLSLAERWQALALVVILSVILTQATVLLAPADEAAVMSQMLGSPLRSGIVQAIVLVAMVFAAHFVGRLMGGVGEFSGALLVIAWLEFVMVCLQVVQMVASLAVPFLAPVIGLFGLLLFFWLLTQFLLVLHGFRSPVKVFIMILITLFGMAFVVALLLGLLGVQVVGIGNV